MKNNELTKEQKLSVIDEILAKYERDGDYQYYICIDVRYTAYCKDYADYWESAVELIPELLMVKPEDEGRFSGLPEAAQWFGRDDDPENRPRRFEVLRKLREIVMKSEY